MIQWFVPLLLLGMSFTLWIAIGGVRLLSESTAFRGRTPRRTAHQPRLTVADVAVLIPAHNEELVIAATIDSVLRDVPASHVHVIADGCTDRTAAIARARGVEVLELSPGRGKAGGIEAAVARFDLAGRLAVLLLVDADTELDEHYIERGLAMLDDQDMVALAGCARTSWHPDQLSPIGRFLVAYRTRLYAVMQWMKYGQTWRHTNVTPIVPGFASMYRTSVLPKMALNPPGLVIEDFNMTFELHHKRLGKIAFRPSVFAKTQDPDNLPDYYRQITRWWLGFWQTVRRHKLWFSGFSAALALFLVEVVLASVVLIAIALMVLLLALPPLTGGVVLDWDWFGAFHSVAGPVFTPINMLLFLFVPDYLLTCLAAIWSRRPSLLVYGIGFLFLRVIDATATMLTLAKASRTNSNGQWQSPTRRPAESSLPALRAPAPSQPPQGIAGQLTATPAQPGTGAGAPAGRATGGRARRPVLLDTLVIGVALLACALVATRLPVIILVAGAVLGLPIALIWIRGGARRRLARAARFAVVAVVAMTLALTGTEVRSDSAAPSRPRSGQPGATVEHVPR